MTAKVGVRHFSIRQRALGPPSNGQITHETAMSDAVDHLNGVLLPIAMEHDGAMDSNTIKNIQAIVLRADQKGHCGHKFLKKFHSKLGLALLRGTVASANRILFKRTWNSYAQDYAPPARVQPTDLDYNGVQNMASPRPVVELQTVPVVEVEVALAVV